MAESKSAPIPESKSGFKRRELTTDKPLGAQLKSVRRTAKLSLAQVEQQTKIRQNFLIALEKGNYEEFSGEVYVRGLLENYAKFLGFPVDEVLAQYKRERGITVGATEPEPLPSISVGGGTLGRRAAGLTITPKTIYAGIVALLLFIAIAYILSQVLGFASPPKLEVTAPAPNAAINVDSVDVEGATDSGAELAINNQPVPTDSDGNFKERVRLLPGTNILRISAKNQRGRERVVSRSVVLQVPQAAVSPSPSPPAAPTGLLLTVKIGPNSAYVTIVADGQQAFQGLLLPNAEQTITANQRILLTTSNGGSTNVTLNGQDKGAAGREGQVRRGIQYLLSDLASPAPSPVPSSRP